MHCAGLAGLAGLATLRTPALQALLNPLPSPRPNPPMAAVI